MTYQRQLLYEMITSQIIKSAGEIIHLTSQFPPVLGGWVKLSEMLPAQDVDVLLYSKTKVVFIGYRYTNNQPGRNSFYACDGSEETYRETDLSHWYPLPALPGESESESE